jgi:hypothetical protein
LWVAIGGKLSFAAVSFNGSFKPGMASSNALVAVLNCIGVGFQRGTHIRWQLVANDGTGAPTLTDMGASFAIATGGVLTLFIAAPPNGSSVWVRVVDEVSGAIFEQEIQRTCQPTRSSFRRGCS